MYATPRYPTWTGARVIQIDNQAQGSSTIQTMKIAPPKLGNSVLNYVGFGSTANSLTISYTPYLLGGAEEVNGVVTILAVET